MKLAEEKTSHFHLSLQRMDSKIQPLHEHTHTHTPRLKPPSDAPSEPSGFGPVWRSDHQQEWMLFRV